MPVILRRLRRGIGGRGAVVVLAIGVAAALSVVTLSNPRAAGALGDGVSETISGMKTVAAMLAERSPGERPVGALANLKPMRQAAVHERALPKVRGPGPAAYEALAGPPPPIPLAAPPPGPLFAEGAPVPIIPVTTGAPFGPPVLSNIPLPGGGGGGGAFPPIVTSEVPNVPPTPAESVPEPASWGLMLVGFALIGISLRRRRALGAG